jgi:hypothetical protein
MASNERIDSSPLEAICGGTLVTASVASDGGSTLSKERQREALGFPLPFVPVTLRGRLEDILDRRRLAEMIAASSVGLARAGR